MNNLKKFLSITTVLFFGFNFTMLNSIKADDVFVQNELKRVADHLIKRSPTKEGRAEVNKAKDILEGNETGTPLVQQTTNPELQYDVRLGLSQVYYWIGTHEGTDNGVIDLDTWPSDVAESRKTWLKKAQVEGEEGIKLFPQYGDAYYYASIGLGRWCSANGVLVSLFNLPKVKKYIEQSMQLKTKAGALGRTYDYYGPVRMQGMMVFSLAKNHVLGNKIAKALELLKEAYENGKKDGVNAIYYVQVLLHDGQNEEANRILDELINSKDIDFASDRLPESLESQETAKEWKNNS